MKSKLSFIDVIDQYRNINSDLCSLEDKLNIDVVGKLLLAFILYMKKCALIKIYVDKLERCILLLKK